MGHGSATNLEKRQGKREKRGWGEKEEEKVAKQRTAIQAVTSDVHSFKMVTFH